MIESSFSDLSGIISIGKPKFYYSSFSPPKDMFSFLVGFPSEFTDSPTLGRE
jgi:hypothetical protein